MKIFIALLMMCSVCYAQTEIKDTFTDKKGRVYTTTSVQLVSDYALKKPVIDETKLLTKDEQEVVEYSLKNNGRRLIHTEVKPAKNDYKHDFDRGTVEHTPKARNYSFHKVIIPDGTVIMNSNFTQKEPHSQAISGKNLTFISCNLVNVEIDPTWIVQDCNTCQIKRILKSEKDIEGQKELIISHQVQNDKGDYVEVAEDKETCNIGDDYSLAILRLNK